MAYTDVWDVTAPLDTQAANQGAADFRATKLDIMQRVASFGAGLLANRPTPEVTSGTANWTGVMYWATDTKQVFMWTGAAWVDISASLPSNAGAAIALATTGAPVVVSGAAPPTVGQVLTAISAVAAVWQTPAVPVEVVIDKLGNVGVLAPQPFFTPSVAGLYLVCIDECVTIAGTAATQDVTINFTDENGNANIFGAPPFAGNVLGYTQTVAVLFFKTVAVTYNVAGGGTCTYNIRLRALQLG